MCVIVPDLKLEHAEVLPKKKLEVLQYNNFFILKYQDAASQWSKKRKSIITCLWTSSYTFTNKVCCTVQMILNYMPNEMTIDVHTGKVHQIVRVGDNVDLMCSFIH